MVVVVRHRSELPVDPAGDLVAGDMQVLAGGHPTRAHVEMPAAEVRILSVHEHHMFLVERAALAGVIHRRVAQSQVLRGLLHAYLDGLVAKVWVRGQPQLFVKAVHNVEDAVQDLFTPPSAADQLQPGPHPHILRLATAALDEARRFNEQLALVAALLEVVLPLVDAHPIPVRDAHVVADRLLVGTLPAVARGEMMQPVRQILVDPGAQHHDATEVLRIGGGASVLGQEHAQVVAEAHERAARLRTPALLGVLAHGKELTEVSHADEPKAHDVPPRHPLHELLADHAYFVDNHHLILEAVVHVAVQRRLTGDAAHLLGGYVGRRNLRDHHVRVAREESLLDPR